MTGKRITRPIGNDIRWWRDTMMEALNEIGVGVLQEFEVVPVEESRQAPRRPGPSSPTANTKGGVRRTDPETSDKAAVGVYPRSGTQRHRILLAIARAGVEGVTAEEVSQATGIDYRSATPRIGELKNGGWVKGNGTTRMGALGAEQEVLVLTERGEDFVFQKEDDGGGRLF